MEILKVEHLSKVYGKGENKVVALDDVSFSVEKGEFVAIVGASGSGKSTLLHLIGGVDRPTKGEVFIAGKNIYGEEYRIDKKENDVWVTLDTVTNEDVVWNSIGYSVGDDYTLEFSIDWKDVYGVLESGKYRIVKSTSEAGEGTTHYITSEFVIK